MPSSCTRWRSHHSTSSVVVTPGSITAREPLSSVAQGGVNESYGGAPWPEARSPVLIALLLLLPAALQAAGPAYLVADINTVEEIVASDIGSGHVAAGTVFCSYHRRMWSRA